jgi:hypothetical protein
VAYYPETPREQRWHRILAWPVTIAALLSIPVVIWHEEWLAWLVWVVFICEDTIMLMVVRRRGVWARAHWFELAVTFVTFPGWHDLFPDLFALEILGALRVAELFYVLKLMKTWRILRRRTARKPERVG